MAAQTDQRPTLWQIDISHYSEKARWALEYKGVDHGRRSALPGSHIPIALFLTRGAQPTMPVLRIDGENVGDSTAIIATLEARFPTRRSIRAMPKSAPGRWSWRTGSTRTSGRTPASSPSTS